MNYLPPKTQMRRKGWNSFACPKTWMKRKGWNSFIKEKKFGQETRMRKKKGTWAKINFRMEKIG
jgi:hypothetical protein